MTTNSFGPRNKFQNNIGFVKDSVINRYTDNYSARRYVKNTENNTITFVNKRYTDDDSGDFAGARRSDVLDKLNSFRNVFDVAQNQGKTKLFRKSFSGRSPFSVTYDYIPENQYTSIENPYVDQLESNKELLDRARKQSKLYKNTLQKLRREYKKVRHEKKLKNVINQQYKSNYNISSDNSIINNNNINNNTLLNNNFIKNIW